MITNEKEINFFSKTLNGVAKKADKQSFKKLIFFAVSISLSFSLLFGISTFLNTAYRNYSKVDEITTKANAEIDAKNAEELRKKNVLIALETQQSLISNINKITPEKYNGFIDYLKLHQNIYDSRIKLLSDSMIAAEQADHDNSYTALSEIEDITKMNNKYKKTYEEYIVKTQKTYDTVKENIGNIDVKDLSLFWEDYNHYKLGLLDRNSKIEDELNSYLYTRKTGNQSYNLKHKVIDQYLDIEKQIESKLKPNS